MTTPDFLPHPPQRVPYLIIPHDGMQPRVEPEELAVVSQKFSALVEDALLNRADTYTTVVDEYVSVYFTLQDSAQTKWGVSVRKRSEQHVSTDGDELKGEHYTHSIHVGVSGESTERFIYGLEEDNIVRRDDRRGKDVYELNELELRDWVENRKLERSMSYNEQPICLEELTSLICFINL